jgi:malate dehydrogenase
MVAAIINDEKAMMPVCAWVSGQYGINDVYLGVPAKLGKNGVEEVVVMDLTGEEVAALAEAAAAVKEKVDELHQLDL